MVDGLIYRPQPLQNGRVDGQARHAAATRYDQMNPLLMYPARHSTPLVWNFLNRDVPWMPDNGWAGSDFALTIWCFFAHVTHFDEFIVSISERILRIIHCHAHLD